MKLKIIRSPAFVFESRPYFPPLGLSAIYSYLKKKGFDIVQEDLNAINHPPGGALLKPEEKKRLAGIFADTGRIRKYLAGDKDEGLRSLTGRYIRQTTFDNIDILLISIFQFDFSSSIMALLMAKYFKDNFVGGLTVMGGENAHAAHIYENFGIYNSMGVVDYYIAGFGEKPLSELLKILEYKTGSIENIPGLCYCKGGEVYRNRPGDQALTVPDFDGLSLDCYRWKPDKFFQRVPGERSGQNGILILPFQIIHGCPNHCAFCITSLGTKLYHMEAREAVGGLKKLSERYNTKYFFFADNTFNISKNFVETFCDEVLRTGLKIFWSDCASPINIDGPELLMKMRSAGACRLIFGMETASPRLLRRVGKEIIPEKVSDVLKWSHDAGIWTGLEIIAGLPGEEKDDTRKTEDFLRRNIEYIDEIYVNKFFLINQSAMFKYPERYGITNIRERAYGLKEMIMNNGERSRYIFDELNGPEGADKDIRIDRAFDAIDNLRRSAQREPLESPDYLNILFYLYARLPDKKAIRHYYNRYRRLAYIRRLFPADGPFRAIGSRIRSGAFLKSLGNIWRGLTSARPQ